MGVSQGEYHHYGYKQQKARWLWMGLCRFFARNKFDSLRLCLDGSMPLQAGDACAGSEHAAVAKGAALCCISRWVLVAAVVCRCAWARWPLLSKCFTFLMVCRSLRGLGWWWRAPYHCLPLKKLSCVGFEVGSVQLKQRQSPRNKARQ